MKKHIVCFGDSNTHGYCTVPEDSADHGGRFNENERWTCLLQEKLGDDYRVIEEGLNGRTTCFVNPVQESMDGISQIYSCLVSHQPVDLLIIMLGTNDSMDMFGASSKMIARGMARLVNKAKTIDCWADKTPNILVMAPVPVGEGGLETEFVFARGRHSIEASAGLAKAYEEECRLLGVHFVDACSFGCQVNTVDFAHLTRESHTRMAEGLAKLVPQLLP